MESLTVITQPQSFQCRTYIGWTVLLCVLTMRARIVDGASEDTTMTSLSPRNTDPSTLDYYSTTTDSVGGSWVSDSAFITDTTPISPQPSSPWTGPATSVIFPDSTIRTSPYTVLSSVQTDASTYFATDQGTASDATNNPPTPPTMESTPDILSPPPPPPPSSFPSPPPPPPSSSLPTSSLPSSPSPSTTFLPSTTPLERGAGFCNLKRDYLYSTRCMNCPVGYIVDCPGTNDTIVTRSRCTENHFPYWWCTYTCKREVWFTYCCKGFWGDNCDECPGGSETPCFNRGFCEINGTCSCEKGFTGTACEQCEDPKKFGKNCTEDCACVYGTCDAGAQGNGSCTCNSGFEGELCDKSILGCDDLDCSTNKSEHWRCAFVDGLPKCVCAAGYAVDNTTQECVVTSQCDDPESPCHLNAQCETTGPGQHSCTCEDGYEGDGVICTPIDPCQTDHGGCDNTTNCVYLAPNRSDCQCRKGYKDYVEDVGCSLVEMCKSKSCDPHAVCTTTEPLKVNCTCYDGYVGDGKNCYTDILTTLKDINQNDRKLRKDLQFAIDIISRFYQEPLTKHGPFTIFVPNDRAFRSVIKQNKGFDRFLKDADRVMQILRQHILIGQFELRDLQPFDRFYTLQGNAAFLQIRVARDVFKYRLHGRSPKAKVIRRNIMASNGMIHVVNNLLTVEPEISGNPKSLALDLIKAEKEYNTFQKLIASVGLEEEFSAPNITVFAPENSAWAKLPTGTLSHLMTDTEARERLKVVLRNHIFPGVIGVTHLIEQRHILSKAKVEVKVSISKQGQIQLDNKANVTQVNIPCRNGMYHHLEGVLVPDYLDDLLPNKCPINETIRVRGPCLQDACVPGYSGTLCPRLTDRKTSEVEKCTYYNSFQNSSKSFCAEICERDVQKSECCKGFFGLNCMPCPGGFNNPCLGRGKCDDTIRGKGECLCEENFAGTACEKCKERNHFGENCTQVCTCLFGQCDDGPTGTGKCRTDRSCKLGYYGENCDRQAVVCGRGFITCHAFAKCYMDPETDAISCKCIPGYRQEGEDCVPINYCEDSDEPPCDNQATCLMIGPGAIKCTCNDGWIGDGTYCIADLPCSSHYECGFNASCKNLEPGQYFCVCNEGFKGDGHQCQLVNSCVINNGGCHQNATCSPVKGSLESVCTGTIATVIMTHPNLTRLARMLEKIEMYNNMLANEDDSLTFFAPSDTAVEAFMDQFRQRNVSAYWEDPENIIWFFTFHTLDKKYNLADLGALAGIRGKYPTLYDGFPLHILKFGTDQLRIFAKHSEFASVVDGNNYALNGWVHIVDQVLEPFFPDDSPPTLETTLAANSEYQLFYQALKEYGLFTLLNEMDEFTVFVPTNDQFVHFDENFSSQHLKTYIVPKLLFTPALDANQAEDTLAGKAMKLFFDVEDDKVYVNGANITRPDVLFDGGVLHEVAGLFYSVNNNCSDHTTGITKGLCQRCDKPFTNQSCPEGYYAPSIPFMPYSVCDLQDPADNSSTFDPVNSRGCRHFCVRQVTFVPRCCSGYFGPQCEACPGGPNKPCAGRGKCRDGLEGNGACDCDPGFAGPSCERCSDPNYVLPHCNITYNSCGYQNGNCSKVAECRQTDSGVTCHCPLGHVGDGYTCTPLCDSLHNGGCHKRARCSFNETRLAVQCTCRPGYHGNGTWCEHDLDPCGVNNGGCDLDRATCKFTPPEEDDDESEPLKTCQCHEGYTGNGTLCSKDLRDAISRIKQLEYFRDFLQKLPETTNGTELLDSQDTKSTLFAPLSTDWQDLELDNLLVPGEIFQLPPGQTGSDTDTDTVTGSDATEDRLWVLETAGGQSINVTMSDKQEYFVNGIRVLEKNIDTTNGIIHLTEFPITAYQPRTGASRGEEKSNSVIIIACVVVAVVLVSLALIAVILYRKKQLKGFLNIFKRSQEGSESNLSFARLNAQEEDDDSFRSPDAAKYDNPVFNEPDYLSL